MLQKARAILKEHFGYYSFKKGQEQIIGSMFNVIQLYRKEVQ